MCSGLSKLRRLSSARDCSAPDCQYLKSQWLFQPIVPLSPTTNAIIFSAKEIGAEQFSQINRVT